MPREIFHDRNIRDEFQQLCEVELLLSKYLRPASAQQGDVTSIISQSPPTAKDGTRSILRSCFLIPRPCAPLPPRDITLRPLLSRQHCAYSNPGPSR